MAISLTGVNDDLYAPAGTPTQVQLSMSPEEEEMLRVQVVDFYNDLYEDVGAVGFHMDLNSTGFDLKILRNSREVGSNLSSVGIMARTTAIKVTKKIEGFPVFLVAFKCQEGGPQPYTVLHLQLFRLFSMAFDDRDEEPTVDDCKYLAFLTEDDRDAVFNMCVSSKLCIACGERGSCGCGGCGTVYCCRQCQLDDWPTHKTICRFLFHLPPANLVQQDNGFWLTEDGVSTSVVSDPSL
jgi:hypothetical protein